MIEDQVLEARREMHLDGVRLGELVEGFLRQRARAVLHRAAEVVLLLRHRGEIRQCLEIHAHLLHRAVRQNDAAVRRAGLDADLGDADGARIERLEGTLVALHEGVQFLDGAVLAADLADLAADGDRQIAKLEAADEVREVRGERVVDVLLLIQRPLIEVHERRGVDVDIVEARRHLALDEVVHPGDFRVRILGVALRVDLHMVALDEDRPLVSLADAGGDHLGGELLRPLPGIAEFGAGDLVDERLRVERLGGAAGGAGRCRTSCPECCRRGR